MTLERRSLRLLQFGQFAKKRTHDPFSPMEVTVPKFTGKSPRTSFPYRHDPLRQRLFTARRLHYRRNIPAPGQQSRSYA
jgi:hypothetical protein